MLFFTAHFETDRTPMFTVVFQKSSLLILLTSAGCTQEAFLSEFSRADNVSLNILTNAYHSSSDFKVTFKVTVFSNPI